jgi:hypothetical protein
VYSPPRRTGAYSAPSQPAQFPALNALEFIAAGNWVQKNEIRDGRIQMAQSDLRADAAQRRPGEAGAFRVAIVAASVMAWKCSVCAVFMLRTMFSLSADFRASRHERRKMDTGNFGGNAPERPAAGRSRLWVPRLELAWRSAKPEQDAMFPWAFFVCAAKIGF